MEKLKGSLEIYAVIVHTYVLMSNHFHLIAIHPRPTSLSSCGILILDIPQPSTIGINGHHGRYKAILVAKDSYLAELSRYVHLNPIRINPYKGQSATEQLDKLNYSAVSRERKRFRERSQREHSLEKAMEEIGRTLSHR